jgi:putative membrane protein
LHLHDDKEVAAMTPPRQIVRAVAASLLLAATAVPAAEPHPAKQASPEVASFVEEAAMGGKAEVELGALAEKRAANPKVKQFGKRMVTDHSKANAELKRLATKKGVTLPSDIGPSTKRCARSFPGCRARTSTRPTSTR